MSVLRLLFLPLAPLRWVLRWLDAAEADALSSWGALGGHSNGEIDALLRRRKGR